MYIEPKREYILKRQIARISNHVESNVDFAVDYPVD